jgi:hypothetical protein
MSAQERRLKIMLASIGPHEGEGFSHQVDSSRRRLHFSLDYTNESKLFPAEGGLDESEPL